MLEAASMSHLIFCDIIWYYWYYLILCDIIWYYVISFDIISYYLLSKKNEGHNENHSHKISISNYHVIEIRHLFAIIWYYLILCDIMWHHLVLFDVIWYLIYMLLLFLNNRSMWKLSIKLSFSWLCSCICDAVRAHWALTILVCKGALATKVTFKNQMNQMNIIHNHTLLFSIQDSRERFMLQNQLFKLEGTFLFSCWVEETASGAG